MSAKRWIGAAELLEDSLRLAGAVLSSGWRPTVLAGLWRGGAGIAVAVHEALAWHGLPCAHLPLGTSLYTGIDTRADTLRIEGLEQLRPHLGAPCRLLLVDDVFDTGRTLAGVVEAVNRIAPAPPEIRIATPWWKPARNTTELRPDFHLHQTEDWLVFPHELQGIGIEELRAARGESFVRALCGG